MLLYHYILSVDVDGVSCIVYIYMFRRHGDALTLSKRMSQSYQVAWLWQSVLCRYMPWLHLSNSGDTLCPPWCSILQLPIICHILPNQRNTTRAASSLCIVPIRSGKHQRVDWKLRLCMCPTTTCRPNFERGSPVARPSPAISSLGLKTLNRELHLLIVSKFPRTDTEYDLLYTTLLPELFGVKVNSQVRGGAIIQVMSTEGPWTCLSGLNSLKWTLSSSPVSNREDLNHSNLCNYPWA